MSHSSLTPRIARNRARDGLGRRDDCRGAYPGGPNAPPQTGWGGSRASISACRFADSEVDCVGDDAGIVVEIDALDGVALHRFLRMLSIATADRSEGRSGSFGFVSEGRLGRRGAPVTVAWSPACRFASTQPSFFPTMQAARWSASRPHCQVRKDPNSAPGDIWL